MHLCAVIFLVSRFLDVLVFADVGILHEIIIVGINSDAYRSYIQYVMRSREISLKSNM